MSLPSGTITFLFTDIEGSTKLWEEQPDTMRLALARHDALLRAAIETNSGTVFKTIGDAFCAAFHTAPQALEAALSAQQSLHQVKAGVGFGLLKVRMALHTGTAEQRDGDYFGQPLNRVARLLAVGHGGQVLLSEATQAVTGNSLPAGTSLRDLGLHRLKDLQQPEQVWQLTAPNLPSDFPPLRSLSLYDNNLPQQVTSFIGREKELAEVENLLTKTRLLTLTGSGGTGKTRLSLQVVADRLEDYPDGVWLVELAPLGDPSLIPQTVAAVLGVRETPGDTLTDTLTAALNEKRLLVLLDNCEHVLDACARLADTLLRSCPHVRILASSREGLGIAGESAYRVPSLSLPDLKQPITLESLSHYESVRLFVERAVAVKSDFSVTLQNASALASVCSRLDGIPLAIELAAARIRSMTVEELGKRLDDRFRILTGGSRTALPRQQTLRALIDWSYNLLEANQKTLLARLCVFAGGWTLEAAEGVCSGESVEAWEMLDLLTALADKSLVIAEVQGETTRYRLLETVRQYARDRLAESEAGRSAREMHRDYFLTLAEDIQPKLNGPEQAHWLDVLETEHDNLRVALTFCLEEGEGERAEESEEKGLRLGAALQVFWHVRGHVSEGREQLAALLSHPAAQRRTKARADALNGAGGLAYNQGDYASARSLYEESLRIRQELGDKQGIAGSLNNLGFVAVAHGNYTSARTLCEEALIINREIGNRAWEANNLFNLGNVAKDKGDYVSARDLLEESLIIRRELGDKSGIANSLNGLGVVARTQGDYASARSLYEESLGIYRELGNRGGIAGSLNNLGNAAEAQGDYASARTLLQEALEIQWELGDKRHIANSLNNLGNVARAQGDYASARTLYEEALTLNRKIGSRASEAMSLGNLGIVAEAQGDYASARILYEESLRFRRELGDKRGIANSLNNLGLVAEAQGDYASARILLEESLRFRRELGDKHGIAIALEAFASLAFKEETGDRASRLWGSASALREEMGSPLPPNEREKQERELTATREALGEEAFAAAWEEGRTMILEQAMAYALGETT